MVSAWRVFRVKGLRVRRFMGSIQKINHG